MRDITSSLDRGTILLKEGFGEVVPDVPPAPHQLTVRLVGIFSWTYPRVEHIFVGAGLLSVYWRGESGRLYHNPHQMRNVISWNLTDV